MKKKILFTCLRMNVGGVEKALLSLINALGNYHDPQGRTGRDLFDIHLALMAPEGGFMEKIPSWVKLHEIKGFSRQQELWRPPIKGIIKRLITLRWRSGIPAAWHFAKSQLSRSLFPYIKWLLRDDRPGRRFADPDLDGEFDLAIDFPGIPGEYLGYYIANHVKARRKASWIHFDLGRVFIRPKSATAIYAKMDRVYAVSEQALTKFQHKFPDFKERGKVFHNLIDPIDIIDKSREQIDIPQNRVNIVTVGRASIHKGIDLSLRALKMAVIEGHTNLLWHFVGGGENLEEYKKLAISLGVTDYCKFHGAQLNPYPFMRNADLYVQPSRHEGYCITIAEAKLFGMPIVATDFVGASEQLADLSNTIIIPNFQTEDDAEIERFKEAILTASRLPRLSPASIPESIPSAICSERKLQGDAPSELADFLSLLK